MSAYIRKMALNGGEIEVWPKKDKIIRLHYPMEVK